MSGTGIAIASALAPILFSSAAVPSLHSSSAQDASDVDVIAVGADDGDRLTIPVKIGANGPYRFLVDTGSQSTVISSALANQLALPAGPMARLVSVAGSQSVGTVDIDEIVLGRRSAFGLRAPLLERAHIGADGILGIDSLRGQRVLFDFTRNLIVIDTAKALGGNSGFDIVVTGRRRHNRLVLTDAEVDGIRTDVVIDSGADTTVGNRALQRAVSRRMHTQPATLYSVTGQRIDADIGLAANLTIGAMGITNIAIAYADSPAFRELELEKRPALLLGIRELRAFKRVAIDFSTWKVLFDLPGV